jgi:uncharacterized protein
MLNKTNISLLKDKKRVGVLVVFVFLLLSLFFYLEKEKGSIEGREIKQIFVEENELSVWTAKNAREYSQGLSGVQDLKEVDGMLFIFPEPNIPYFWMKDMNFPLDIIWINKEMIIKGVEHSVLPESYPEKFEPKTPIKYVLEVRGGWVERAGVEIGDTVYFGKEQI